MEVEAKGGSMNLNQFKRALMHPDEPWKEEERNFWEFLEKSVSTNNVLNSSYFEETVEEIFSWPPGKLEELYTQWNIEREDLNENRRT